MAVTKLQVNANKKYACPTCGSELGYVEGGAVSIVNGRVDMSSTLPKYTCEKCGVYYQELLNSGYYDVFTLPPDMIKPKRTVLPTGDLKPAKLKRDADGKCTCPRCGDRMDFVESQPVIRKGERTFSLPILRFDLSAYCQHRLFSMVGNITGIFACIKNNYLVLYGLQTLVILIFN